MEARAEVAERELDEINGHFDCHRGEINHLKTREKDAKKQVDELGSFIIGAAHEAETFKYCLDRMSQIQLLTSKYHTFAKRFVT